MSVESPAFKQPANDNEPRGENFSHDQAFDIFFKASDDEVLRGMYLFLQGEMIAQEETAEALFGDQNIEENESRFMEMLRLLSTVNEPEEKQALIAMLGKRFLKHNRPYSEAEFFSDDRLLEPTGDEAANKAESMIYHAELGSVQQELLSGILQGKTADELISYADSHEDTRRKEVLSELLQEYQALDEVIQGEIKSHIQTHLSDYI